MPAPVVAAAAAAAPTAAALLIPEASKLASSLTAHLAAALGTPLLKSEEVRVTATRKGVITRTTSAAVPAWAAIAAGGIAVIWFWGSRPWGSRPTGPDVVVAGLWSSYWQNVFSGWGLR